jgi:hypothetical protein
MDVVGEGSLKIVVVTSPSRDLEDGVEGHLVAQHGADDVRSVAPGCFLVHTCVEPAAIRDSLSGALGSEETVFVAEFERWSSRGPIDTRWLLRRGH